MGDKIERAHPRYPVGWRATFRCASWEIAAKVAIANVSRRGMFLRTKNPPACGTTVALTLELPNGDSLQLDGVVRYAVEAGATDGREAGAGVELDARHDTDLRRIEDAARNEVAARGVTASAVGRITLSGLPALDEPALGTSGPMPTPKAEGSSPPVTANPPPPPHTSLLYSVHRRRRK